MMSMDLKAHGKKKKRKESTFEMFKVQRCSSPWHAGTVPPRDNDFSSLYIGVFTLGRESCIEYQRLYSYRTVKAGNFV